MKKLLFVTAILTLLAAGCKQTSSSKADNNLERIASDQHLFVNPETIVSNSKPLNLKFTLKPTLPLTSPHLQVFSYETLKDEGFTIPLNKQPDGTYTGEFLTPQEWLSKPQRFNFELYEEETAHPLFQSDFAITDTLVTLPPDPGYEGLQTIAGIDSNHDGLRDDIERKIVFINPESDEMRRVLRAMFKVGEAIIENNPSSDLSNLKDTYFAFDKCYVYLLRKESGSGVGYYLLEQLLKNTSERAKRYTDAGLDDSKSPRIYTDSNINSQSCSQPLVNGKY